VGLWWEIAAGTPITRPLTCVQHVTHAAIPVISRLRTRRAGSTVSVVIRLRERLHVLHAE